MSLSALFRAQTREAHVRAGKSGIMRAILRGRIERTAYVRLAVLRTETN